MALSGPRRVPAGAIAGAPVVVALGAQRAGQRERLTGLAMAPEQLHRAPEAEQRVVVGGGPCGDSLELGGGVRVALRVKQRPSERLADRVLVGLEFARPAQRDDRGLVIAVVEQLAP